MFASLRIRLLGLVLVAVVPIALIVALWSREQRRLLVARASGEAAALAHLVAERHQRSVDAARGLLLGMSRMRSLMALDGPACAAALAPLLAGDRIYVNIAAARRNGELFCSGAPARTPVNVADREFFKGALRTGGFAVGDYVVSRVRGKGALGFGYPVRRDDGTVVAVGIASLAVSELQRELDELPLPEGAQVAVLDRTGISVSARPDGPDWAGRPFDPGLVAVLDRASGPVVVRGADGIERLYDLQRVTAPDGSVAMRVLAGLPTAHILAPVNAATARAVWSSVLAIAVALALAGIAAEFGLVRRIRRLGRAAQLIAAGDWAARAGLRPQADELGDLARTFDEMARSLEELDREKRRQEEQLRQAQKMEAVGQLAGGVAHDFNNLLTVILSAASAVRDRLPPKDPGREDAGAVIEAGERAATLTRQLLAFSRRQHLAPRVVDLGETVRRMERMLKRLLREGIALKVRIHAPARVHADPAQVEVALLNLAVNARDAMPAGGPLDLEVDALAADDPRRPSGVDVPDGPLAVIVVRDGGVGMDAATQARLFEPFFTTKGAGRGTGLGLSIVLGVVAEAQGLVRVDSAPGRGTEFRLYLPLHVGEVPRAAEGRDGRAPRGTERVLVIEDDPALRVVVLRALANHGYQVIEAANVGEARKLAGEPVSPPDLVLSDVILPDGNGIELAPELLRRWPAARVLFMSGYLGEHLPALDGVARDGQVLPKPFTADTLLVRVREALAPGAPRAAPPRVPAADVEGGPAAVI